MSSPTATVKDESGAIENQDCQSDISLQTRILLIADLKTGTDHIEPLAQIANITMVCINPNERVESVRYRTVPSFGYRPIGLMLMFFVALFESRKQYDAVSSFSLLPHGCFALVVGWISRKPIHLGIIGIDLDVHARAPYKPIIHYLFMKFTIISVPGKNYENTLINIGVEEKKIAILRNAINTNTFRPIPSNSTKKYDYIWVGRFSPEKAPLRFIEALGRVDQTGIDFNAVMLGDGPLQDDVYQAINDLNLTESINLPGWVNNPDHWYRKSRIFVLTSDRDALPMALIEGMATGLACVAPKIGSIPEVIQNEHNGLLVSDIHPNTFSEKMIELHTNDDLYEFISHNATSVRDEYSFTDAKNDWENILTKFS